MSRFYREVPRALLMLAVSATVVLAQEKSYKGSGGWQPIGPAAMQTWKS